jgi:hypothetical protein
MNYHRFESFCNSFTNGYLKPWKSFSIWNSLENEQPEIKVDSGRLLNYLRNCLRMEGFIDDDIKTIAVYIELNGEI